jgi:hypothetical protein
MTQQIMFSNIFVNFLISDNSLTAMPQELLDISV